MAGGKKWASVGGGIAGLLIPSALANADSTVANPTTSPASNSAPLPAPTLIVPAGKFSLPSPVTTTSLKNARLFPEPLVPIGAEPSDSDNAVLAAALTSYASTQDLKVLEKFADGNAGSAWRVSVLTNLGLLEFKDGYFSKALADWNLAWSLGKSSKAPAAQNIVNRAVAELIKLYNRVGRMAESKELLAEVKDRSFRGVTAIMINEARQAVGTMELHPADAFKCGPYAVSNLLEASHQQTSDRARKIKLYATTPQGTSLQQVLDLAGQVGLKMQAARRVSGDALPLPAVVHWKLNHYGALLAKNGDRYLLVDPTFGTSEWVRVEALKQEASGYFLISGPLPAGWKAVNAQEAGTVWGRGLTDSSDGTCTKGGSDGGGGGGCGTGGGGRGDSTCPTGNCPPPKGEPCGGGTGMAQWTFFTMLACLHITDTPLYYQPPVGPAIVFRASYASLEQNQPATINYSNLGPLWNFSYISTITFDSANAYVDLGGGGSEDYVNFNSTTQSYDPQSLSECVLVEISPSDYERRAPNGSKMVYTLADSSGRLYLTQVVDPQGNAVTLSYDANFRTTTITDAIGQVSRLAYGSNTVGDPLFYNVVKVTDPFGRFASFSYNGSGQLTQITDVLGIQSQFSYGANDFIQSLTTPYGTTQFAVTQTNTPNNGTVTSLVATEPGGAQQRVDAVEVSTVTPNSEAAVPAGMPLINNYLEYRNSYFWDRKAMHDAPGDYTQATVTHFLHLLFSAVESGIVESTKAPLESRVWNFYQNENPDVPNITTAGMLANPLYVGRMLDDGSTQLYQNSYDTQGFVTQKVDPSGRTTNYSYAANGIDLLTAQQVNGGGLDLLATYTWNNQHRALSFTGADGETYSYTYNAQGQMLSLTDPLGEMTTGTYDNHGYLQSVQGPDPGPLDLWKYTYDPFGRVQTITDGDGYTLTFAYDALNRQISTTYPDGTSNQVVYTNILPTQSIDRLGRATNYGYNSLLQLISITDPLNRTLVLDRCACGAILRLIDPLGQTTSWGYDIQSRPTTKTFADASQEIYTYDGSANRTTSVTDTAGQKKAYSYNLDDSLSGIVYSSALNPTPNVSVTYDPSYPRPTSIVDGIGTTTYAYQPVSGGVSLGATQVSAVSGPWSNAQCTYSYDPLGRLLSRGINGLPQTIGYDVLSRITSITNALGAFTYTYENDSPRVTNVRLPNGQNITAGYFGNNSDRRLKQIKNLNVNGSPLSEFDYTYDPRGNILTWNQANDGGAGVLATVGFDAADRVTSVTSSAQTYGYSYDTAGNRLTQAVGGVTSTANYNPLNQLQQVSPALGQDKTYLWDAENRLVGINYTGTNLSTRLAYDGFGRCAQILELDGSTIKSTKRFLWSGLERCEEHDALDNVTRRFFNQGEQIAGAPYYYTTDHLGSIREMTDGNGSLHARYSYDPFGTRTKLLGDLDASFGFTRDYFHHVSGLHLAVFRAYDAAAGRWLSRDPIGEEGGVNLYAYVGNRMLTSTDLLGYDSFTLTVAGQQTGPLNPGDTVNIGNEQWQYAGPITYNPGNGQAPKILHQRYYLKTLKKDKCGRVTWVWVPKDRPADENGMHAWQPPGGQGLTGNGSATGTVTGTVAPGASGTGAPAVQTYDPLPPTNPGPQDSGDVYGHVMPQQNKF